METTCTLFCDDIRREDSGKAIIIGAYTSNVIIPHDTEITHLSNIWVINDVPAGEHETIYKVFGSDGAQAGEHISNITVKRADLPVELSLTGIPFPTPKSGKIRLTLSIGGTPLDRAAEIMVQHAPEQKPQ